MPETSALFACPHCHGPLDTKSNESALICKACNAQYPIKGTAWDLRTIIKDQKHHWDSEEFDRAYAEADDGFEDGTKHALKAGIPELAERYRQSVKGQLVKDFIANKQAKLLLDLGCGCGWFCFELAELSPDSIFHGCDVSAFRVNVFKEQIEKTKMTAKMDAAIANAENLPFPDGAFDIVVMREVLEHLAEPEKALREINRILVPGGYLALTTPTKLMTVFWETVAIVPTLIKRLIKREKLFKKPEIILYDKPLSKKIISETAKATGFQITLWKRTVFLPHESYLQFIPMPIIHLMIKAAHIINKLPFLHCWGMHHVIFLRKPE